jgi:hypothetical protein
VGRERRESISIYLRRGARIGKIIQQLYCTHRWLGILLHLYTLGRTHGLEYDDEGREDKAKKLGKERQDRGREDEAPHIFWAQGVHVPYVTTTIWGYHRDPQNCKE